MARRPSEVSTRCERVKASFRGVIVWSSLLEDQHRFASPALHLAGSAAFFPFKVFSGGFQGSASAFDFHTC